MPLFYFIYFLTCIFICVYVYSHTCICMSVWKPDTDFGCLLSSSIAVILSSTLMDLTRLPGQQAAEILLSAIPHWDYRHGLPQWTSQSGAGDRNAGSYACVTKVYIWKSPPNPSIII